MKETTKLRAVMAVFLISACQAQADREPLYSYAVPTKSTELPRVLLNDIFKNCVANWTAKNLHDQGQIIAFCSCTQSEIKARINFNDYIVMDTDIRTPEPSEETKRRGMEIMAKCEPILAKTGKPL